MDFLSNKTLKSWEVHSTMVQLLLTKTLMLMMVSMHAMSILLLLVTQLSWLDIMTCKTGTLLN